MSQPKSRAAPAACLMAAALMVAPLLALAGGRPAAAEEVNLYSSRHYDTDNALYDDFTKATGIEVNLIEGAEDQLIERIKAEGRNSPADVLITVDAGRLWRADQAGILQPVSSPILDRADPAEPAPTRRQVVRLQPAPANHRLRQGPGRSRTRSRPTRTSPTRKWRGRVCMRTSNNVYNQSLVGSMIETHGRRGDRGLGQGPGRQLRPPAAGRRHRPDPGGRGRRVRCHAGQSLLPGPAHEVRRRGRARPPRPRSGSCSRTRTAAAPTPTSAAPAWSRPHPIATPRSSSSST